jgi:hypothetical protein
VLQKQTNYRPSILRLGIQHFRYAVYEELEITTGQLLLGKPGYRWALLIRLHLLYVLLKILEIYDR